MTDAAEKTGSSERMVLRTVYLPPELDEKLRVSAFRAKQSKGDVIRRAIAIVLESDRSLGKDSQTLKSKPGAKVMRAKGKKGAGGTKRRAKAAGGAG